MAMTIDAGQRTHFGPSRYDRFGGPAHFSNPWSNSSGASGHSYDNGTTRSLPIRVAAPYASHPPPSSTVNSSSAYSTVSYGVSDLLNSTHAALHGQRPTYEPSYSTAPSVSVTSYATTVPAYAPNGSYVPQVAQRQHQQNHTSQTSEGSMAQSQVAYVEAINGAKVMADMSQSELTPRNIYAPRSDRQTADSYGFPTAPSNHSTHSTHSSISSGSGYQYCIASSTAGDSSTTDYSSASESLDGTNSRTLPRPGLTAHNLLPNPQAMMGSFSSKISSNTQKKHRCKICDKRFTRPSSLQTHMYSHTGEKPFACEIAGCGRNFSVVSNLRRHRKVHKGERTSDDTSPEGSWCSRE